MPVWISSTISSTPRARVSARRPAGSPASPESRRPRPAPARASPPRCASPISRVDRAEVVQRRLGKARPPSARTACPSRGLPDADMVASVRPWKRVVEGDDLVRAAALHRPHLRASLIAPSFASAPLLAKNTWSKHAVRGEQLRPGASPARCRSAGLRLISWPACAASACVSIRRAVAEAVHRPALDEVEVALAAAVRTATSLRRARRRVGPRGDLHQRVSAGESLFCVHRFPRSQRPEREGHQDRLWPRAAHRRTAVSVEYRGAGGGFSPGRRACPAEPW